MITHDSKINRQFPSEKHANIWDGIESLGWRTRDGDEQELKNQEAGRKFCGEGESNNHYMALVEEFVDKIFFEKDEGRRYRGKNYGQIRKITDTDIGYRNKANVRYKYTLVTEMAEGGPGSQLKPAA